MLESAVEAIFAKRVKDLGGRSFKFAPVVAGNPDRLVLMPGGVIRLVEIKADCGVVEPIQVLWHERAAKLGTVVEIVRGAEEARKWE